MNIALVLSVFIYMWIIVGMNLFGNLKILTNESGINRHANFAHFPAAMLTMLRCGEAAACVCSAVLVLQKRRISRDNE